MADQDSTKVKGVADIVFLLDVTGSMQPCIDALVRNIGVFIDTLTTRDANNANPVRDWRAKAVGYRDFTVDSEPYVDNPFVRDSTALKGQLAALRANGGGDEAESLLDALFKVATMPASGGQDSEDASLWRHKHAAARVVVVFTDAPYKPTMSIPEANGGAWQDIANRCAENRIILSLFAPDRECYNDLASIQRSEYFPIGGANPQQALVDFTSDQANFQKTLEQLARSVSKSAEVVKL